MVHSGVAAYVMSATGLPACSVAVAVTLALTDPYGLLKKILPLVIVILSSKPFV